MDREVAVIPPGVAAVLGDVVNQHAIHQAAPAVGQDDGVLLRADAEVRVGHGGSVGVAILAGAEDHIVSMGGHHRPGGEAPAQGLVLLVGQGVVVQADGLVSGVVQLHPVHQLAVLVSQAGKGIWHDFADDQRAVGDHGSGAVLLMALRRIGVARAEQGGGGKGAVLLQGVAFVPAHDGQGQGVNLIGVGVEQVQRLPHRGQLELGMEGLARLSSVGVRAEHHHPLVRLEGHIGEQEADGVVAVAQADVLQADLMIAAVPDLHPVGEVAVFIGDGGAVGGHDLAEHQPLIGADQHVLPLLHQAAVGAGGVGGPADGLLGRHDHNQRHRRNKNNQPGNNALAGFFLLPDGRLLRPAAAAGAPCGRHLLHAKTFLSMRYRDSCQGRSPAAGCSVPWGRLRAASLKSNESAPFEHPL